MNLMSDRHEKKVIKESYTAPPPPPKPNPEPKPKPEKQNDTSRPTQLGR
jgi:hypothetical protein